MNDTPPKVFLVSYTWLVQTSFCFFISLSKLLKSNSHNVIDKYSLKEHLAMRIIWWNKESECFASQTREGILL